MTRKINCKAVLLSVCSILTTTMLLLGGCSRNTDSIPVEYIGIDAAKETALDAAGLESGQVTFTTAGLDNKNGIFYYRVEFQENDAAYSYDIDALTGVIIEERLPEESAVNEPSSAEGSDKLTSSGVSPTDTSISNGSISESEAKAIALSAAGLTEDAVTFTKVKQDEEDGISVYDIEFFTDDKNEYDFDIRIEDGAILSYEFETHGDHQPVALGSGTISLENAIEIVLARVPGAAASDVSIRLDEHGGRQTYKGELIYNNMEYEFRLDAYSGSVLEWEAERK
ncbi:MAG: PepSY domain-containing protein [Clostridiales bacterium]|nr:PepSY domain-containing protein [Clostridiales bacterium]